MQPGRRTSMAPRSRARPVTTCTRPSTRKTCATTSLDRDARGASETFRGSFRGLAARRRQSLGHDGDPHARLAEDPYELPVEVLVLDLERQDVERLVYGHGALVGSIAGGQGI